MDTLVALLEPGATGYRISSLEAENARLRYLLSQATQLADIELQRNQRLGRIVETARVAAEETAALHRRDLEDGAARLASAEELNAQLRASEEFNRRILWTTNDFVAILDLHGRLITMSENGPSILGLGHTAAAIGRSWSEFWARPEAGAAVRGGLHEARIGRSSRFQARLEAVERTTWWDIAITPIDGADERPERILAVARDITELKLTEARQTLLMQELAHRMKNTLALVQAVAAQTLRNAASLDTAADSLSARLQALAQAHDVLLEGSFASASLVALVASAVALHGDGEPGRFHIDGPEVLLSPPQAMTLALMLHELGTNATKYGALSVPEGHVSISWLVSDGPRDEGPVLCFRWEEIDGPPVSPPTRSGFGTRLIARSLARSFGGTVQLAYPVTGAVLTFESALQSVAPDAKGMTHHN
jgi:PAS domain S-box-containing protein